MSRELVLCSADQVHHEEVLCAARSALRAGVRRCARRQQPRSRGLGLSSTADSSAKDSAAHNPADVKFAKDMIPHHGKAIAMAKLAATRASSPQVKALTSKIEGAQDP